MTISISVSPSAPPMTSASSLSAAGSAAGSSVGSAVGSAVGASVGSAVGASVGSAVGASVGSAVGASVGSAVGASVGSAVGASVGSAVGASVGASVTTGAAVVSTFFVSEPQPLSAVSASTSSRASMACFFTVFVLPYAYDIADFNQRSSLYAQRGKNAIVSGNCPRRVHPRFTFAPQSSDSTNARMRPSASFSFSMLVA